MKKLRYCCKFPPPPIYLFIFFFFFLTGNDRSIFDEKRNTKMGVSEELGQEMD